MQKVERRDLINYAFVSQGIFGASDLLAAILPLIQPIVAELNGQVFNPTELADKIADRFPWNMNPDAIELLPPRMEKLGWVKKIFNSSGEVAYLYQSIPAVPYDETQARQLEEKLSQIGLLFHEFINEISPLEGIVYTAPELVELLLRWFVESGGFNKPSIISAVNSDTSTDEDIDGEFSSNSPFMKNVGKYMSQENYICGRFIQHISIQDHEIFDDIVSLSALTLIAEVILTYSNPNVDNINTAVDFYYDGPFIMDLLGLTGKNRQENASYINESLIKLQISPRALDHSCDEIRDNLNAMHAMPRPRRHGPTWAAICRADIPESFADDVRQNVEVYVEKAKLPIIVTKTAMIPNEDHFFPEEERKEFGNKLNWERRLAAERDALSLAFIMQKRRGQRSTNIFKSRATFITRNEVLAGIARRYCMRKGYINNNHIPPVLHQRTISALLFLTLGSTEKREISRRELMSTCDDIVRCRPDLIEGMRNSLTAFSAEKAEMFDALILRPRSTQLLMDLTLGANELIADNAEQLFEKIRLSAGDDISRAKDKEIKEIKTRHIKQLSKKNETLLKRENEIEKAEDREDLIVKGWFDAALARWDQDKQWESRTLFGIVVLSFFATFLASLGNTSIVFSFVVGFGAALIPAILLMLQVLGRFPNFMEGYRVKRRDKVFYDRAKEACFYNVDAKYNLDWGNRIISRKKQGGELV